MSFCFGVVFFLVDVFMIFECLFDCMELVVECVFFFLGEDVIDFVLLVLDVCQQSVGMFDVGFVGDCFGFFEESFVCFDFWSGVCFFGCGLFCVCGVECIVCCFELCLECVVGFVVGLVGCFLFVEQVVVGRDVVCIVWGESFGVFYEMCFGVVGCFVGVVEF